MKILIAAAHFPVASGRFIARAFRRLGHDVRTVGPAMGNEIWGMKVEEKHVWNPDWVYGVDGVVSITNPDDAGWIPDLEITADCGFTITSGIDCPHVVWGMDNHVRRYDMITFDAYFLAHSWANHSDEPKFNWLPPCYDPEAHTDLVLADRPVDVGMVAVAYQERIDMVGKFMASNVEVKACTGLLWEEYNMAYNLTKIALVKSMCGDLTQRFFEGMAQGCCVLADRVVDAEKLGFIAGVDYWTYSTPDEAVREAKMLIDTGLYKTIAKNGQNKVRSFHHTWDDRALKLLETMGMNK